MWKCFNGKKSDIWKTFFTVICLNNNIGNVTKMPNIDKNENNFVQNVIKEVERYERISNDHI